MLAETNDLAQTQLRHLIAERLRAAILANEFQPGDWLRQEQLAQQFGVSQTPVREALQDLVGEGVVERVPYRGIRVIEFTLTDLRDLYACRAFMEGLAARNAAQHITRPEIAELRRIVDEMAAVFARKKWNEYRDLNRQFHQGIYAASRHPFLIRTLNQLWTAYPTMMLSNFPGPIRERRTLNTREHRAIIAALETRAAARVERLMRRHIEESARRIQDILRGKK
ncbi:MAG: GntR family transcriptional regulator [Chloroflexi bacterium]|nr:GntR family transcriptional regulator [Chloroflexota bacterium]